jgi:hypothetical protein
MPLIVGDSQTMSSPEPRSVKRPSKPEIPWSPLLSASRYRSGGSGAERGDSQHPADLPSSLLPSSPSFTLNVLQSSSILTSISTLQKNYPT